MNFTLFEGCRSVPTVTNLTIEVPSKKICPQVQGIPLLRYIFPVLYVGQFVCSLSKDFLYLERSFPLFTKFSFTNDLRNPPKHPFHFYEPSYYGLLIIESSGFVMIRCSSNLSAFSYLFKKI